MTHRVVIIKPPRKATGVRARFESHIRRKFRVPLLERFEGTGELAGQYKYFHTEQTWQGYRAGYAAGRRK